MTNLESSLSIIAFVTQKTKIQVGSFSFFEVAKRYGLSSSSERHERLSEVGREPVIDQGISSSAKGYVRDPIMEVSFLMSKK